MAEPFKLVAIHQPNFFPWLGYFDKINRADYFILLDDVSYPKSSKSMGSWCNRVKVNIQGQPAWVSCAVKRESGIQIIRNVAIDDGTPWRSKLLRTLYMNYCKSPHYQDAFDFLESLIQFDTDNLCTFNAHAIQSICTLFGIKTKFLMQSELQTSSASTALLVDLVKKVNGNGYLCGGGAGGYQEDQYQEFKPQPYKQFLESGDFLPGLSIIDYLLCCGLSTPFDSKNQSESQYCLI